MKNANRVLSLLLCLIMVVGLLPNMSFAAEGETNIYMTVSDAEVDTGDTFTVTIGHVDMFVSSFAFGLYFDKDLVEVTSIVVNTLEFWDDDANVDGFATATSKSTVAQANEKGLVGVAFARATESECYGKEDIMVVTFKAKAEGTVQFDMFEDSAGTDTFKSDLIEGESIVINEGAVQNITATLVTDVTELNAGDQVIIVAADSDVAMSTNQKKNNRGQASVTKNGNTVTFMPGEVQILTLQAGNVSGTYAFYTGDGYLYAASSSGNYLRTEANLSNNSSWAITIADGTATVVAQGSYTRNLMQYNKQSSLFACYASNKPQQAIQIYKLAGSSTPEEPDHTCSADTLTRVEAQPATCQASGLLEHYVCTCGKLYLDADATTETTLEAVTVAQGEHDYNNPADARKCVHCGIYKDGSTLTVDEVLAYGATLASGATTEYKYYVVGTITEVANTKYGNMNITDDDENSLLIYGLYKDGVRYDAMETKPVAGDIIKVYGPIMNYKGTTVEIVDAELIEHTTPECTHENAVFQAGTPSTCSVAGTVDHWYCPDCDRNFADEACTEVLTDISAELGEHDYNNTEDARRCVHCGYYKPGSTLTIPEANEFGNDFFTHDTFSEGKYFVTGTVVEIKNSTFGNVYIEDAEGNRFYIYGIVDENGTKFDQAGIELGVGDVITVYGIIGNYNGAQMKNAVITDRTPAHVCGEGTLEETEQLDAQCGVAGHKAYWTCSCEKVYADAEATTLIDDLSAWLAEGGDGYIAPLTHKDEDPKDHKCDRCGEPVSACTATLTETEKQEADCGNAGHKAYWTCTLCGKHYSDANATTEIADLAAWLAEGGAGYIPATGDHNYVPGTYTWSEDYSTCTVTGTCGCGATATATANSTSSVIAGTCQTAEVVTYTADFAETWAVDQSKEVTGEKNMDNHVGELAHEYVDYYEHKEYYTCCPDDYDMVEHDDYEDECSCGAIGVRVYFYGAYYGEPDPSIGNYIYGSTFFVLKDQDLRLKIYPGGNYPYVSYSICDYALEEYWLTAEDVLNATELVVSHTWYDAEDLFITVNAYSIQTIDLNGGSLTDEAKESWGEFYDAEKNVIYWPGTYGAEWNLSWYTEEFVREGCILTGFMDGDTFCALDTWIQSSPENRTLTLVWKCENEHANTGCTVDEDGTHTITCDSCGEVLETFEGHRYDAVNHKCVCGAVETFKMYVEDIASNSWWIDVPFGANFMDYIPAEADTSEYYYNDPQYKIGKDVFIGWSIYFQSEKYTGTTMPAGELEVVVDTIDYFGWFRSGGNWIYCNGDGYMTGWTLINHADYLENGTGSDWYYMDPDTGYRAEGLTRVPYPTVTINGITYAANQDALDYCEEEGITFIDEFEAWFLFDEDGKLLNTFTGVKDGHYYENGMQTWHPGAVEGMYFIGDMDNGGNIPANGDTYIIYPNDSALVEGAIYHFTNGVLSGYEGIEDGKYYEGSRLMIGNGLTKLGENYIFVRSNGYIVVDAEYYVGENDLGIASGMYYFDENGFMVAPVTTDKDGVYYENGAYYYYQDGKIAYGLGLIQISANWYDGEGGYYENVVVYVRSNGQLATGYYYVTNIANYTGTDVKVGDKVLFSFQGTMMENKNGIVGNYYYENNSIAYGAGLIEYNGGYIYVRSDGTVVKNTTYWITNTHGLLDQGCYEFDENGMIIIPETYGKTGIIDGYYYVDGKIAYGMGLLEIEEGVFIYVRSNGQLATGEYYITNLSNYEGTDFKVGDKLIFGKDGKLTVN